MEFWSSKSFKENILVSERTYIQFKGFHYLYCIHANQTKSVEASIQPLPESRVRDADCFGLSRVDFAEPLFLREESMDLSFFMRSLTSRTSTFFTTKCVFFNNVILLPNEVDQQ